MSWKYIKVDEYTYNQVEQAIKEGKGNSRVDVMRRAMANYLGIRYKTPNEIKLEQELVHTQQLGKMAAKEE